MNPTRTNKRPAIPLLGVLTLFAIMTGAAITGSASGGQGNDTTSTGVAQPGAAQPGTTQTDARPWGDVIATPLEGEVVTGTLAAWDANGIRLRQTDRSIDLPADQLLSLRWRDLSPPEPATYLLLVDGSRLPFSRFEVTDHVASVLLGGSAGTQQPHNPKGPASKSETQAGSSAAPTDNASAGGSSLPGKAEFPQGPSTRATLQGTTELKIPTEWIDAVQLLPEAAAAGSLWRDSQQRSLAGDLVVVLKRKTGSLDSIAGILGDLTPQRLVFQWDGQEMQVKRSKVAAIAYYHAKLPKPVDLICRLETAAGGRLHAASLSLQGDMLHVATCCGMTLDLPVGELVHADYSPGKLVYLSDMIPIRCEWTPRVNLPLGLQWIGSYGRPRTDAPSFTADPGQSNMLQLIWPAREGPAREGPTQNASDDPVIRSFSKGLAIRSRTEIVYRLPRKMRRFHAIAGIAPATASQGNVDLTFYCDNSQRWQGVIDGDQPPIEIGLNIEGVRELTIVVDYGENLDWGDQLHLVEARVTK